MRRIVWLVLTQHDAATFATLGGERYGFLGIVRADSARQAARSFGFVLREPKIIALRANRWPALKRRAKMVMGARGRRGGAWIKTVARRRKAAAA